MSTPTLYRFQAIGTDRAGQLCEINGTITGPSGFPQSVREAVRDHCASRGVTVNLAELGSVMLRDCQREARTAQLRQQIGRPFGE